MGQNVCKTKTKEKQDINLEKQNSIQRSIKHSQQIQVKGIGSNGLPREISPIGNKKFIMPSVSSETLSSISRQNVSFKAVGGSLFTDIRKIYKFREVMGGGNFGTVRVGYKRSEGPKKFYAIKSISKKNLSKKNLENLIREVDIISELDHPNIIKFYETYHDQFYFHIVMELCRGREVFDQILADGKMTEQKVSRIIAKVLHAISYCHSKGVSHRDLKPDNLLFETTEPDAEIKLIDFGLSRKYGRNEKMHSVLGSPYYVAPEVLKGEYDEKCDIWSIGAMTYIMLSGNPPFAGDTNYEIFSKIVKEDPVFETDKWENISADAVDFIKNCLCKLPEKRPSASQALLHPWFTNILKEVHSEEFLCTEILTNLKNYSSPQKFKKIVLKFLVNMLSQKELKKLNQAFYAIDYDHSGHINIEEFDKAFKIAGIETSREEIQEIIHQAGDAASGKIGYSGFVVACLNQKKEINKDKLVSAFNYFDFDNSGYIDSSDLKNALLRSGKKILDNEDINKMIKEVAQKSQERISLEDFLKLFDMI